MIPSVTSSKPRIRERLATVAGSVVRSIGRGIPGTVGPGLVVAGVYQYSPALAAIVGGVILWAIDRKV